MYKRCSIFFFLTAVCWHFSLIRAQSADQLIYDLQAIHKNIRSQSCTGQQVISNRAMNLFLSDKIGSYLTGYKSLSFYKNYITLNAAEGIFSLNHNLFESKGTDEPVKSFYVVGVKGNAANALVSAFTNKTFSNELGVTIQKTWIGKPKTILNNCFEKNVMDIKRESISIMLEREIKKAETEFINSLASTKQEALSDSDFTKAKTDLLRDFYVQLRDEFSRKFASLQYKELATSAGYKYIATHWTNFAVYLPIILKRFTVAESFATFSASKKAYPFEASLSHTRFWESKKAGRFFLNVEAGVYLNNSAESHSLENINYDQYRSAGGKDSLLLRQRKINSIFIGDYQTFLTPAVKLNFVYYPPDSHIGLSTTLEKNMGTYKALNWVLGIPVVLIDKEGAPSSNFEFQLRYFDILHAVFPNKTFSDNVSINLVIGIPFSKIIY